MSAMEKAISTMQAEFRSLSVSVRAVVSHPPPPPPMSLPRTGGDSDHSESDSCDWEEDCPSPPSSHHRDPAWVRGSPAPLLDGDPWGETLVNRASSPLDPSFWDPKTDIKDPDIPEPSPLFVNQGIECQGLGSAAWDRIRYVEAEKKLRMGGMFQPLTLNSCLEGMNPSLDFSLRQQERLLGTLCHGLILQRSNFKETLTKVLDSCPAAKSAIKELFTPKSLSSTRIQKLSCSLSAESELRSSLLGGRGLCRQKSKKLFFQFLPQHPICLMKIC